MSCHNELANYRKRLDISKLRNSPPGSEESHVLRQKQKSSHSLTLFLETVVLSYLAVSAQDSEEDSGQCGRSEVLCLPLRPGCVTRVSRAAVGAAEGGRGPL